MAGVQMLDYDVGHTSGRRQVLKQLGECFESTGQRHQSRRPERLDGQRRAQETWSVWWYPYVFLLGIIGSAPFSTRHGARPLGCCLFHQGQHQRLEAQVVHKREKPLSSVCASRTLPYSRTRRKTASRNGVKNVPDEAIHFCCVSSSLVLGASVASGSEMKNVEPSPSVEVNQIRPPCHSMSSRQR